MTFEAKTFHMNTVIIPVVADMPTAARAIIPGIRLIKATKTPADSVLYTGDQRCAQGGSGSHPRTSDAPAGSIEQWPLVPSMRSSQLVGAGVVEIALESDQLTYGETDSIGALEKGGSITTPCSRFTTPSYPSSTISPTSSLVTNFPTSPWTPRTRQRRTMPQGIDQVCLGESFPNCTGRRDCGWRHVIHAIQSAYLRQFHWPPDADGGGYTGKLIYAASSGGASEGATDSEYNHITWWDAVDYIGVDAFFPLTQNADVSVPT